MRLSDAQVAALREVLDGPAATSSVTVPGRKVVAGKVAVDLQREGLVLIFDAFASITPDGKQALQAHEAARIRAQEDATTCFLDELVFRTLETAPSFTVMELVAAWRADGRHWWGAGGDCLQARRHATGRLQRHVRGMRERGELVALEARNGGAWQHLRYAAPAAAAR